MAELRKNPLTREWVVIMPARAPSPQARDACPYCPGNEALSGPELLAYRDPNTAADTAGWRVRVVADSASFLQPDGDPGRCEQGIYDIMRPVGGDEVVVETPIHDEAALLSDARQAEDALWACRQRYSYWAALPSVKSVIIGRHHPGRSPEHPHWRLLALPVVPQPLWDLAKGMAQYYDYRGRCGICHIAQEEARDRSRVVTENRHFLALAPYFSVCPYELWILPRRHHEAVLHAQSAEMHSLAQILCAALGTLKEALHDPHWTMTFMNAPCNIEGVEHFHWFLRVLPQFVAPTPSALECGVAVNTVAPEAAAERLRRAAPVILGRAGQVA
jgi:UDPglucose--hexose-1-phosphate uridylyltransferase